MIEKSMDAVFDENVPLYEAVRTLIEHFDGLSFLKAETDILDASKKPYDGVLKTNVKKMREHLESLVAIIDDTIGIAQRNS